MHRLSVALLLLSVTLGCSGTVGGPGGSGTGGGGAAGAPAWCAPLPAGAPAGVGFAASWVTLFGEASSETGAGPSAVAVAANGDTVVAGSFVDHFDLGTGTVLASPQQAYLARLSPAGKPLWVSEAVVLPNAVVADPSEIWVSSTIADINLARFDAQGAALWTWPLHPYGLAPIARAGGGDVWLASGFIGSFDAGSGTVTLGDGVASDVALLRFTQAGGLASAQSVGAAIWPQPSAASAAITLQSLAPMPGGGVLVLVQAVDTAGSRLVLVHLDGAGQVVWTRQLPEGSGDADGTVVTDAAGNAAVLLAGTGESAFSLGCGTVGFLGAAILYVTADGTPRWSRSWDWSLLFWAAGFDAAGDLLAVASQEGPVDVGGGMLPYPAAPTSTSRRSVVVKYASSGAHLGSRSLGDGAVPSGIEALTAAVTPAGEIVFAGAYSGAPELGLPSGPLPMAAKRTGFLAKLVP